MAAHCLILFISYILTLFSLDIVASAYTLTASESIADGQILVSRGEKFKLGFFSPSTGSNYQYLGIWYNNIPEQTIVWVGNRDSPLNNTSRILRISSNGNVVNVNQTQGVIWSSNSSRTVETPVLDFLESGNLVLRDERDENPESYLWQSFDYPTQTLLSGMKLGRNSKTGTDVQVSSWRKRYDPSTGDFSFGVEGTRVLELCIRKGSQKIYRSGPWNGMYFCGAPDTKPNLIFSVAQKDAYFTFRQVNQSSLFRMNLTQTGSEYVQLQRFVWLENTNNWKLLVSIPRDRCDDYALCGIYSTCDVSLGTLCRCLQGFMPKSPQNWNQNDWTEGCEREVALNCSQEAGFRKYRGMKLPETTGSWVNSSMTLEECRVRCLNNCSCMAYSASNISGDGTGCLLWFMDPIDIRQLSDGGQDLYVQMPASELDSKTKSRTEGNVVVIASITTVGGVVLLGLGSWCLWKTRSSQDIVASASTLTASESVADGQTLVSRGGKFKLGFFSPSTGSKHRYLGIWYNNIPEQTIVWVGNRDSPLNDTSGFLRIGAAGNIEIVNRTQGIMWSSNLSRPVETLILEFLESGNLILRDERDEDPESYVWQSFDHPTQSLLPGMKLGVNFKTGNNIRASSWKSSDDPSTGNFTFGMDDIKVLELYIRKGSQKIYRSGPWNGIQNSGSPDLKPNSFFIIEVVQNTEEVYYTYRLVNQSSLFRMTLTPTGSEVRLQRFTWVERTNNWQLLVSVPRDLCDNYAVCGTYSTCDVSIGTLCRCLQGFRPKSPQHWSQNDWTEGCEREVALNCSQGVGFRKYTGIKLPETASSWVNRSMTLDECRVECLKNCSCIAYSNLRVLSGGGVSGCLLWSVDLIDIREISEGGDDLYIKMPASELDSIDKSRTKRNMVVIVSITSIGGAILLGLASWYYYITHGLLSDSLTA